MAKHAYLLLVLLLTLACNFVDRAALGLMLQNIKGEFQLSDTQLGFLSGIAFALFYSVMGIPIARWADRGNRVAIIALSTALWSAAVALCSLATGFIQLVAIRVTVAIGEAGCIPPALSLIADRVARAERPRAVSIFMLGAPLSLFIGYFAAGWINQLFGWRATFVILGLPGIALAALTWLTLRDPRSERDVAVADEPPGIAEVARVLWANRTFRHLLLCFAVVYFFGFGVVKWQPAFFMRSHGMQTGELGTWLALVYGVGGGLGTYLGGAWASRYAAQQEHSQLRATAFLYAAFGLVSVGIYLATSAYLAFAVLLLTTFVGAMTTGPLFATIQTLVPEKMRAVAVALVYLCGNLIGLGLGPLAAGALSDALQPVLGAESLRYALAALCPGYLWGSWHLWRASKSVADDVRAVEAAVK